MADVRAGREGEQPVLGVLRYVEALDEGVAELSMGLRFGFGVGVAHRDRCIGLQPSTTHYLYSVKLQRCAWTKAFYNTMLTMLPYLLCLLL